jgi:hypothetical protein
MRPPRCWRMVHMKDAVPPHTHPHTHTYIVIYICTHKHMIVPLVHQPRHVKVRKRPAWAAGSGSAGISGWVLAERKGCRCMGLGGVGKQAGGWARVKVGRWRAVRVVRVWGAGVCWGCRPGAEVRKTACHADPPQPN